jgi:hypothetical protein
MLSEALAWMGANPAAAITPWQFVVQGRLRPDAAKWPAGRHRRPSHFRPGLSDPHAAHLEVSSGPYQLAKHWEPEGSCCQGSPSFPPAQAWLRARRLGLGVACWFSGCHLQRGGGNGDLSLVRDRQAACRHGSRRRLDPASGARRGRWPVSATSSGGGTARSTCPTAPRHECRQQQHGGSSCPSEPTIGGSRESADAPILLSEQHCPVADKSPWRQPTQSGGMALIAGRFLG